MAQIPGIAINGVAGRMGRMLVEATLESDQARLAACLERPGHDWIGRDLGEALGGAALGVVVTDDPDAALSGAAAAVDFTTPDATLQLSAAAAKAGAVHVVGTTGMSDPQIADLERAASETVVVRAGNMSLGVNLLVQLTRKVAAALGEEFDIEVIESHHRHKADAPSGTALMLGDAAADGRGVSLGDVSDRGRDGITGPRKPGHIGFSAVRGGDIVGEHDVLFAGPGERIVLRHVAADRMIFARGALRAALWGVGHEPGSYDMIDVLGL